MASGNDSKQPNRRLRLVRREDELNRPEDDSIEQKLDMLESGPLRGDEILHSHGRVRDTDGFRKSTDPKELPPEDEMLRNYRIDMSEPDREGDEMSGDEHSLGLQGGEPEIEEQENQDEGLPGDETTHDIRKLRRP